MCIFKCRAECRTHSSIFKVCMILNADLNIDHTARFYMVYQEGQKHRYGSTRISKIRFDPYFKNKGRPVNLRVDPYFRYGSTRIFAGRPVNIRVDPYFYGSTHIIRVDPYFCGSTRIFTGRPVFYGSTCIYGSTRNIRVDPYFTGRPVS